MRVVYVAEYALWLSVMGLFRVLGLARASDLGGWLARTIGPRLPVTRRARRNMARCNAAQGTPILECRAGSFVG